MNPVLFWIMVGWFSLNGLMSIIAVGKPRRVTDPGDAAITVLIMATFIVCFFAWGR
jgi:hypothetical protein